MNHELSI